MIDRDKRQNCIVSGFQLSYLKHIIPFLQKEYEIKLIIVNPDQYKETLDFFNDVLVLNRFDIRIGKFDYKEAEYINGVDGQIRTKFEKYISGVINMFSRMDANGVAIPADLRNDLFWKMANYWYSFIRENDIDFLLSREIPHFPSEYLMYRSVEMFNGKVLMTEFIEHLSRRRFIPSLENRSIPKLDDASSPFLQKADHLIERLKRKYEEAIDLPREGNAGLKPLKELVGNRTTIKTHFLSITYLLAFGLYKNWSEKSNMSISFSSRTWNRNPSRLRIGLYFAKSTFKIRSLEKFYKSIVNLDENNLPEKYVFFAASYQPEATTNPDGNGFYDIPNVLRLIRDAIPKDFKIIYKEHPSVFNLPKEVFWRGHLLRSKRYYEEVRKINGLMIADTSHDTFNLMDNAVLTACISGSILIECSARGRKAICFGNAWHANLDGIHKVSTKEEIGNILKESNNARSDNREIIAGLWESSFDPLNLTKRRKDSEEFVKNECNVFIRNLETQLNEKVS